MFKRVFLFLLLLLLPLSALAEDLSFTVVPAVLRPGKTERIGVSMLHSFSATSSAGNSPRMKPPSTPLTKATVSGSS